MTDLWDGILRAVQASMNKRIKFLGTAEVSKSCLLIYCCLNRNTADYIDAKAFEETPFDKFQVG